jgi:hypothetical protein
MLLMLSIVSGCNLEQRTLGPSSADGVVADEEHYMVVADRLFIALMQNDFGTARTLALDEEWSELGSWTQNHAPVTDCRRPNPFVDDYPSMFGSGESESENDFTGALTYSHGYCLGPDDAYRFYTLRADYVTITRQSTGWLVTEIGDITEGFGD